MKEYISFSSDSQKKQLSSFIKFLYDIPELSSILNNPEFSPSEDNPLFLKYDGRYLIPISFHSEEISELFASEVKRENFLNALSEHKDCVKEFIDTIVWKNKDYLNAFCEAKPEIIDFMILKQRKRGLEDFKKLLDDPNTTETAFQKFFEKNKWVFNICLEDRLLLSLSVKFEATTTGQTVKENGRRADGFVRSQSSCKYSNVVFVEIKSPQAPLGSKNEYKGHAGVFAESEDLGGGVAQILRTARDYISETKGEILREKSNLSLSLATLKLILVIGNQEEFYNEKCEECRKAKFHKCKNNCENNSKNKCKKCKEGKCNECENNCMKKDENCNNKKISFDLYRDNQKNVTIITYDELYEKAKAIVESCEYRVNSNKESDDSDFSSNKNIIEEQ